MRRLKGYPRWLYPVVMVSLLLLFVSGIWLLPGMLAMRLDIEVPWHPGGGQRLTGVTIHALAGFIVLGLIGALAALHMRLGWRKRSNHLSGLTLLVLFVVMMFSTLGIYYSGNPQLSVGSSITHVFAAFLAAAIFAWHSTRR